jgi:steroid delta-isomerase-like uncharacterized protein
MSNHKNITLVHKWAEYWDTKNVEGLLSIFTPDGIYQDMAIGHVSNGADEIRKFFEYTFTVFPDFRIEFKRGVADEDCGFCEWIMAGTHTGEVPGRPPSGKAFRVPGVSVMIFENGLIKHNRDFWNKGTFDAQAGK